QMNDARRCIGEAMTAMEATKERWYEAEVYRMAGEITLKSPECVTKAEAYFQHALVIARAQQAKSWELRAALSMARLLSARANRIRPQICWLRSTAGSLRASTPVI